MTSSVIATDLRYLNIGKVGILPQKQNKPSDASVTTALSSRLSFHIKFINQDQ